MLKKFIHLITLMAMLTGLLSLNPATPVNAASLTVNTLTDENDGSCLDGDCSLRDAIQVANDNDSITFSVTGTIILTSALTVDKSLSITGPGSAQLTLDGNNQYQIFILSDEFPTNTINISGMTMTKGYANPAVVCGGGAIRSWAFLTMNDVAITNNHAPADAANCFYPRGGGILFFDGKGSLTLTNSTIRDNSTAWGGGGIHFTSSTGNISLNNVIIDNNLSTGSDGGGIEISNALSAVTITNSTFSNNDATSGSGAEGGGVKIYPTVTTPAITIQNSIFSANTAYDGGGIYVFGSTVNITNSTIVDNSSSNNGGGLFNYNGTITINSSTFEGNIVTGGINSYGGGIYNLGNADTASITIVNSTLTGNSSTNGNGGAIYNQASGGTVNDIAIINIYNSTIVGNSAKNSVGGGGIFASTAGGAEVSTINLFNSIVYGNTLSTGSSGENCVINNDATIVKNNNNLFQTLANDCFPGVNDATSTLATSAVVNALASNGGATQTMSLPSGSPAIDAGSNAICAAAPVSNASQNNINRPSGVNCDIGAYEKNSLPSSPTFDDVPLSHPYFADIEILYANGYTAGCSTSAPLLFCPETTMNRAQSAVFMVRGNFGTSYSPPAAPWTTFGDDFAPGPWAQPWAQGMFDAGLTAGCSNSPRLFCPWEEMPRFQAAVFGMRLREGINYPPPAGTGTVFADIDGSEWYAGWVEQAYLNGLLPACGSSGGTPLFCPNDLVPRGLAAYMIVRAKNLTMP